MNKAKRLFIYCFLGANIFITLVFWWLGSSSLILNGSLGDILIALGRVTGLIAELMILTQLVLISRISFVEKEFGFDKLNKLHRLLGKIIFSVLIFHPVFLTIGYSLVDHTNVVTQFLQFLTVWDDVLLAFLGFLTLCIVVGFSLAIVRKKLRYETWHFVHLFVYVAIGLFFWHQVNTADVAAGTAFYYWYVINFSVFGLLILYRFIKPIYASIKYGFKVEKIVQESPTVHSIYISGKNIATFTYEPGQFAHLTFLIRKLWPTHPFSFSQAPYKHLLRFSIKNVGDFTSLVHTIPVGTRVIIDGPLGVFTEKRALKEKYLFIAGGIGITPIRSLIESLNAKNKDIVLMYGIRTKDEAVFKSELDTMKINYHLILSAENDPAHETGYVTEDKIRKLAPDFPDREIYVCGPPIMMQSVIKELEGLGVEDKHIHHEIFAF